MFLYGFRIGNNEIDANTQIETPWKDDTTEIWKTQYDCNHRRRILSIIYSKTHLNFPLSQISEEHKKRINARAISSKLQPTMKLNALRSANNETTLSPAEG